MEHGGAAATASESSPMPRSHRRHAQLSLRQSPILRLSSGHPTIPSLCASEQKKMPPQQSPLTVLPGDVVPADHVPSSEKKQLRLGPGFTFTMPSTVRANVAGIVRADYRKNALWLDAFSKGGRVRNVSSLPMTWISRS